MKRILFTGGGTAGHVTPNLALIEVLQQEGWRVAYAGSKAGIERTLVTDTGIQYYPVATGKLRRYFSWQNFIDPLWILLGCFQSLVICLRFRPAVVFSKGGFVAVPVVVAAWVCRIPVIVHESDMTPGLANRLCFPFARRICVNFPQTLEMVPSRKAIVTGSPVRRSLLLGEATRGRGLLGLSDNRPVLLVFGGSLGAASINAALRSILDRLCEQFDVVHIAGPGNLDPNLTGKPGYWQFEFLGEGFGDVLAAADLVVARAGANSVYELLVTRTPHILIPLPLSASRGDQIQNARAFEGLGMSLVLPQENLSPASLADMVEVAFARSEELRERMATFEVRQSVELILALIREPVRGNVGKSAGDQTR